MDFVQGLSAGFAVALTPWNLLYCFIGVFLGTVVGILPGLGPTAAIALLFPVTFRLDAVSAIIMLAGIYYGTQYGGSITSILVNIPGEAASVVTCLDGYRMARQGRAGPALGIAAFGSFIAGTLGVVALMFLAPPLSAFALRFGPPEYFALMVAGLTLAASLGGSSLVKSLAMVVLGLFLGTIGLDPMLATDRFTYGIVSLNDGIGIVPVAMGLFGLGEVFIIVSRSAGVRGHVLPPSSLLPTRQDWRDSIVPISRGSVLGFLIGVIPGGGPTIASFASYAIERRFSRYPERFGTGTIEGVAGPESANNAAVAGAFIPLLTLGIPGNVVIALLLGAFMIHGVVPGPALIAQHPNVFWGVVASMYVGNVLLLILNVPLIGLFVQLLKVPERILAPLIIFFSLLGGYSIGNNVVDVLIMVIFGMIGYLMRKFDYESAPLVLGLVLGPQLETALRQSLRLSSGGSPLIFLSHPISAALLALAALSLLSPYIYAWRASRGSLGFTKEASADRSSTPPWLQAGATPASTPTTENGEERRMS